MPSTVNLTVVKACARCGHDHVDVHPQPLTRPMLDPLDPERVLATHWWICPETGEPLMVAWSDAD